MKAVFIFAPVFLVSISLIADEMKMRAPAAPFIDKAQSSTKKSERPAPMFDAVNLTFVFGSKRLIFKENGTFSMVFNGRKILSSHIFIATPFRYWQTNEVKVKPGEYKGEPMSVTSCKTDKVSKRITFEGIVPFHPATSTEYIIHPWRLTATLQDDGKVKVEFEYSTPDGKNAKDKGIFFNIFDAEGYDASGIRYTMKDTHNKAPAPGRGRERWIKTITRNPVNSIRIDFSDGLVFGASKGGFRLDPFSLKTSFTIDPLDYSVIVRTPAGGVDFKESDDLTIPTRGKNLLLNPYMGQGYNYIRPLALTNAIYLNDDAMLGKYSIGISGNIKFLLSPVPAAPGKYIFSCYAKGKGKLCILVGSESNRATGPNKTYTVNSLHKWQRLEFSFETKKQGAIAIQLQVLPGDSTSPLLLDCFQLERGIKATAFSAPMVEARLITDPEDGFLESGKQIKALLELSTIESNISGQAVIIIRNFFSEVVFTHKFNFLFTSKEFPRFEIPLDRRLPDGIYVIEVQFMCDNGLRISNFFRFSIMPFLKNEHKTAKLFSDAYGYFFGIAEEVSEKHLERERRIGVGIYGHAQAMGPKVIEAYRKYNIIPFDGMLVERTTSENMKKMFPKLMVPEGHTWFYIRNLEQATWAPNPAVLADYRLLGGWSSKYKEKFQKTIIEQLKKDPGKRAYLIGSEWANEIKDDPHYIDMVIAFFEAVKSIYPNAWVYEGGACNMDIKDGIAQVDNFLTRLNKRWKPDFLATHPYMKDITQLYSNFQGMLKVAEKHGLTDCKLTFPEGMHFYPYAIPEWGCEQICWMGEGWVGGTLTYDLGWTERLSAAYFMRCYLVYLTEFERVWCATSSALISGNVYMDTNLTPRAYQKIPNTLGILLGNPKKYLGNYTFSPQTRCFIWEDENGYPLAAVWNENSDINAGVVAAPGAKMEYRGAEYIDMMGVKRIPIVDGEFYVSPFPLFIRGKKGDCQTFIRAISCAILKDANNPPFRIVDELSSVDTLKLTLINDLARPLSGIITILGKNFNLDIKKLSFQDIIVKLPSRISTENINELKIPVSCNVDGHVYNFEFKIFAFAAKRFNGDWNKIPAITIRNRISEKTTTAAPFNHKEDFEAKFQVAWDVRKLYLRVTVDDDILIAGKGIKNRWNYDVCQVYMDTRCSARKTGEKGYDSDDYEYSLMPTTDGLKCEVFRAISPDIQLTLGIAAPKNNLIATEIPTKFTRTATGYIYEAEFPANYILPAKLMMNYNMGFGLYVADRDNDKGVKQGLSLATELGRGCFNSPHLWPLMILTDN